MISKIVLIGIDHSNKTSPMYFPSVETPLKIITYSKQPKERRPKDKQAFSVDTSWAAKRLQTEHHGGTYKRNCNDYYLELHQN